MKIRNYDKLTSSLPQLQDRIKKDCESYKNEFLIQLENFYSNLDIFKLNPSDNLKNFSQLIIFMAHVAHCYTEDLKNFPNDLQNILRTYSTVIHPEIRFSICKALILLKNKSLLLPTDLLSTFFDLFHCQDKNLRQFLKQHLINDIKKLNLKCKDLKKNSIIQNFIFYKLKENNITVNKCAIDIMIQLYRKNVWNDAKTVNKISECCFSKHTKILVAALTFFTGKNEEKNENENNSSSDSESENKTEIIKKVLFSNKVNKKTRRRKKILEKTSKAINQDRNKHKIPKFNFSALYLIYDPQEFADRLLRQLEKSTERYEVKLLMMDLISRLIGVHQLMILNFYTFIQRYLQPHQKDVTKILLFVSQASHELVLPDILENIIRHIAFNFITERNSPECMTVGLNTVREICKRCPLSITAELLQDFADYKKYKNKNVAVAAKSLIQFYRITNPDLLKKSDRGRKTIAMNELKVKEYGESSAINYIPGAELLDKNDSDFDIDLDSIIDTINDVKKNINISSDNEENKKIKEEKKTLIENDLNLNKKILLNDKDSSFFNYKNQPKKNTVNIIDEKLNMSKKIASEICSTKILSQEDFEKLRSIRIAKQVKAAKSLNTKRKNDLNLLEDDILNRKELVSLSSIERLYKRSKLSKEERSKDEDLKGRKKLGRGEWRRNEKSSKTEKERQRNKTFMMIKHKVNQKKKYSFKSKQLKIKNALIKQLKAKKL